MGLLIPTLVTIQNKISQKETEWGSILANCASRSYSRKMCIGLEHVKQSHKLWIRCAVCFPHCLPASHPEAESKPSWTFHLEQNGKETAGSLCFLRGKRHRRYLEEKTCGTQQQEAPRQRTVIATRRSYRVLSLGLALLILMSRAGRHVPWASQPPLPQSHCIRPRPALTAHPGQPRGSERRFQPSGGGCQGF